MTAFVRFWVDFIIGDDWRVAAGVAASVLLCALLVHGGINAWWLMPIGAGTTLGASASRRRPKR
jgi:hypothetical protein